MQYSNFLIKNEQKKCLEIFLLCLLLAECRSFTSLLQWVCVARLTQFFFFECKIYTKFSKKFARNLKLKFYFKVKWLEKSDLWLKCRFYEFDDVEWWKCCFVMGRNGCVWLWILAGFGLNREPEWLCMILIYGWMPNELWAVWLTMNYEFKPDGWDGCWSMIENESNYAETLISCDFCTSTIGDEGFPG